MIILISFSKIFAQTPTVTINPNSTGEFPTMSSYLLGVGRNHYYGRLKESGIQTNISESRLTDKIAMYKNQIPANIIGSGNGHQIYRIGHNITEGTFGPKDLNSQPGWHWATDYMSEGNITQVLEGTENTIRIGAGVHSFYFKDPNSNLYTGYSVTHNYPNTVGNLLYTNRASQPKSKVIRTALSPWYIFTSQDFPKPVGFDPALYEVNQVGGPTIADTLKEWSGYEIVFRIVHKSTKDVGYFGYVVSFCENVPNKKIISVQGDAIGLLNPSQSAITPEAIMESHSKMETIRKPKIVSSSASNYASLNENVPASSSSVSSSPLSINKASLQYDRFSHAIEEANLLNADLAIVINIATGYPEEAVALLKYLNAMNNIMVAYVELGNELMGAWNRGVISYYNPMNGPFNANTSFQHPTGLGKAIRPFADKIKNDPNPLISSTKIAATSAYNIFLEYYGAGGTAGERVRLLKDQLVNGSTSMVDYYNFHNYPGYKTRSLQFNPAVVTGTCAYTGERYRNLAGMNQLFTDRIADTIRSAFNGFLTTTGVPVGIINSESNSASADKGCNQNNPIWQQNTIAEGLYFAESFMSAAKKGFHAYTNFGFIRTVYRKNGEDNVQNPPTQDGTIFGDAVEQDVHFYPNSDDWKPTYDRIYLKPTFRVKSMIAKNLARKILAEPTYSASFPSTTISDYGSNSSYTPFTYKNFGIMATQSDTDPNELRILIINRSLSGNNLTSLTKDPLKLVFTGRTIDSSEMMFMAGKKILDLEPATNESDFSILDPTFKNIPVPSDGVFNIPRYSVCILRIKLAPNTSCTAPTLSCKTGTITVNFPPSGSTALTEALILNASGNSYGSGTNCEGTTNFSPTAIGAEGIQTVTVTRTNSAGLTTSCTAQVIGVKDDGPCTGLYNVSIVPTSNSIVLAGLVNAVNIKIKLYGPNNFFQETTLTSCSTNACTHTFSSLASGQYTVEIKYRNASGIDICSPRLQTVTVGGTPTVPSLSISSKTVNESDGSVTVTVSASAITTSTMTVNYATSNGTALAGSDYTAKTGTITFNPGVTSMDISVPILNNTTVESTETFNITLSSPVNSTIATGTGVITILDDDEVAPPPTCSNITISTTSNSITVANLSAPKMKVKLYNSNYQQIQICETPNCALPATTFSGLSTGQYYVEVQYFTAAWSSICSTGFISVVLSGTPPPSPVLSIADVTVNENVGSATITVTLTPAATSPVTVNYSTANGSAFAGSDYTATTGTLTFTASATSRTFTVPIINDNTPESTMSFGANLSSPSSNATIGDGSSIVTILDDDYPNLKVTYLNAPSVSGTTVSYQYKLETLGANITQSYTLKLYRSTNATLEPATDVLIHTSTFAMGSNVGQITAWKGYTDSGTTPGVYYILKVDADNAITESTETDNVAVPSMPVSLTIPTSNGPALAAEPKSTIPTNKLVTNRSENAVLEQNIIVYPNPTDGLLNIAWESPLQSLFVFDLNGRLLADLTRGVAQLTQLQLDCSNWSSGLYILQGSDHSGVFSTKFYVK